MRMRRLRSLVRDGRYKRPAGASAKDSRTSGDNNMFFQALISQ